MKNFDFIGRMQTLRSYAGESFEKDLATFCKNCGYTLSKDDEPILEDDETYLTEIEMLLGKQTFYLDQIDMKLDKLLNK